MTLFHSLFILAISIHWYLVNNWYKVQIYTRENVYGNKELNRAQY